ncbi:MAG: DNA replication/repair protein RecF [Bacteroidota bacterium]
MKLQFIRLRNFRNHAETTLDCADGCNLLLGDNGQGKTNLLEAIAYLSLTKSVFGSGDTTVLSIGKDFFETEGRFQSDAGIETDVRASYSPEGDKCMTLNGERIDRFSDVVGMFPIVTLFPEHHAITLGAPADRRKFIDFLLSQASKSYLLDLLEYRRILRQRNRILQDQRGFRSESSPSIESWDEGVIRCGSRIVNARLEFLEPFQVYLQRAYKELVEEPEAPSIQYVSTIGENSNTVESSRGKEQMERLFRDALRETRADEARVGMTLVGPHRDELAFSINRLDVRKYASQGQHKTFLIGLKAAEFAYLRECRMEKPIMLLDDVFGELDDIRTRCLFRFLETVGQTFITAAKDVIFSAVPWDSCRKFTVAHGSLLYEKV